MKLVVLEKNLNEFDELEKQVRSSHISISDMEDSWVSLDQFFSKASTADCHRYFFSYFRLYVDLTWKLLSAIEKEKVAEIISTQIYPAVLLGYDVKTKLLQFLGIKSLNLDQLLEMYTRIRSKFINSDFVVGKFENRNYIIKDFIADETKAVKNNLDSLASAEMVSKIGTIINSNGKENIEKYFIENSSEAAINLINITKFFIDTTPEKISIVVDSFINLEIANDFARLEKNAKTIKKDNVVKSNGVVSPFVGQEIKKDSKKPEVKTEIKKGEIKKEIKPPENKPAVKASEKAEDPMFFLSKKTTAPKKEEVSPKKSVDENLSAPKALAKPTGKKTDMFASPAAPRHRISYKEIRKQIEGRFTKDKYGHFANITDVISELQKISIVQEDPHIKDLYYFNEQAGGFEWNENLLKD